VSGLNVLSFQSHNLKVSIDTNGSANPVDWKGTRIYFRYNETLEKNVCPPLLGNFRICGYKYDVQYNYS